MFTLHSLLKPVATKYEYLVIGKENKYLIKLCNSLRTLLQLHLHNHCRVYFTSQCNLKVKVPSLIAFTG